MTRIELKTQDIPLLFDLSDPNPGHPSSWDLDSWERLNHELPTEMHFHTHVKTRPGTIVEITTNHPPIADQHPYACACTTCMENAVAFSKKFPRHGQRINYARADKLPRCTIDPSSRNAKRLEQLRAKGVIPNPKLEKAPKVELKRSNITDREIETERWRQALDRETTAIRSTLYTGPHAIRARISHPETAEAR